MKRMIRLAAALLLVAWAAPGAGAAAVWWKISADGTVHVSNAGGGSGSESAGGTDGSGSESSGGGGSDGGVRQVAQCEVSGAVKAPVDLTIPAAVQSAIATAAATRYPDDSQAQRYAVAKQQAAWRELQSIPSAQGVPQAVYDGFLSDAAADYPGDYAAQLLAIETRVADYRTLHGS